MEETLNPELRLAWDIAEHTGRSLFLTGRAGTGKTTFLKRFRESSMKRMIVLAPTGIAAVNAGGVTIHSFFQLPPAPFAGVVERDGYNRIGKEKARLIRGLDLIVIDEVSMVRSDLLDAVDYELRRIRRDGRPFGGVQMVLIGDLQQLPPVVTERDMELLRGRYDSFYFFGSHALHGLDYVMVELQKVYRQRDSEFIGILNSVRDNRAGERELGLLNSRYLPGFEPPAGVEYIRLTTHNEAARRINESQLEALPGKSRLYRGTVKNTFPESAFPVEEELKLKPGAQVMFLKNDNSGEKRYYNGLIGKVESLDADGVYVRTGDNEEPIYVTPEEWKNITYSVDEKEGKVEEKINGTYRQLPLKTAWAVTIHKSQGLTFSHAIIDASRSFAHGQCYVALSRCRTLEGIVLGQPLTRAAIINDPDVSLYLADKARTSEGAERALESLCKEYRQSLLDDVFSYRTAMVAAEEALRVVEDAFSGLHRGLVEEWRGMIRTVFPELMRVAGLFGREYRSLIHDGDEEALRKRLEAANGYFAAKTRELLQTVERTPAECDNSRLGKRLKETLSETATALAEKIFLLGELEGGLYTERECLEARGSARLEGTKRNDGGWKARAVADTVANPDLLGMLSRWRAARGEEEGVAPCRVLSYRSMLAISESVPLTKEELRKTDRLGTVRMRRYGNEILGICRRFKGIPEEEGNVSGKKKCGRQGNGKDEVVMNGADLALRDALREWRLGISRREGVRAYMIFNNAVMDSIVRQRPDTKEQLALVKGIPSATASRYGNEILYVIVSCPEDVSE